VQWERFCGGFDGDVASKIGDNNIRIEWDRMGI
jgi:hypothetical protein